MTNAQLIGRETMIARLIEFHAKRINGIEKNELALSVKLSHFTYDTYMGKSIKIISKEYDETFSTINEVNGRFATA